MRVDSLFLKLSASFLTETKEKKNSYGFPVVLQQLLTEDGEQMWKGTPFKETIQDHGEEAGRTS